MNPLFLATPSRLAAGAPAPRRHDFRGGSGPGVGGSIRWAMRARGGRRFTDWQMGSCFIGTSFFNSARFPPTHSLSGLESSERLRSTWRSQVGSLRWERRSCSCGSPGISCRLPNESASWDSFSPSDSSRRVRGAWFSPMLPGRFTPCFFPWPLSPSPEPKSPCGRLALSSPASSPGWHSQRNRRSDWRVWRRSSRPVFFGKEGSDGERSVELWPASSCPRWWLRFSFWRAPLSNPCAKRVVSGRSRPLLRKAGSISIETLPASPAGGTSWSWTRSSSSSGTWLSLRLPRS